jgi:hypothetical protein
VLTSLVITPNWVLLMWPSFCCSVALELSVLSAVMRLAISPLPKVMTHCTVTGVGQGLSVALAGAANALAGTRKAVARTAPMPMAPMRRAMLRGAWRMVCNRFIEVLKSSRLVIRATGRESSP